MFQAVDSVQIQCPYNRGIEMVDYFLFRRQDWNLFRQKL